MLVIKIFSERKNCEKIRAKRSDFLQGMEHTLIFFNLDLWILVVFGFVNMWKKERESRARESSEEILSNRSLLLKELNDINSIDLLEATQKSKVRWAIEGDENTKFFHGILNSKRSQLAVCGTFVNGEWIVDPLAVKKLSSYAFGHLKVSELAACLEKLHFPALLVMSKFSKIYFLFVILEVLLSEYFGFDMNSDLNFLCSI
uniref:RNA-directed DNA polymerase, eukaryota n=1 Tax=Tanacetum cinerariifolium TaxID=118510 RepID=A0A6L2LLW4_TANCI|nr:RNA-directed DNA polymerase, eukaryota [Tanacetum cinerariifolium]